MVNLLVFVACRRMREEAENKRPTTIKIILRGLLQDHLFVPRKNAKIVVLWLEGSIAIASTTCAAMERR